MKPTPKKLQEENRDLWYQRISEKSPVNPEDEPVVRLMEYFDLLDEFGEK